MILSENFSKNSKILENFDDFEKLEFELKEGLNFNLGIGNDFKLFRQKNSLYIDKSLFIRDLINDICGSHVLLITRPRRWGKSLNMSMLKYFFGIEVDENGKKLDQNPNKYLFNDLKISHEKIIIKDFIRNTENEVSVIDYFQGKYPVILLSLKEAKGNNFLNIKKSIGKQIYRVYETHEYLLKSPFLEESYKERFIERLDNYKKFNVLFVQNAFVEDCDLDDSLEFLTRLLYQHHKEKSYILIDEYDFPVNILLSIHVNIIIGEGDKNQEFIRIIKDTINLICSIISPCSKSSEVYAPEKVILIGINDILVKEGSSGLNNIKTIRIDDYSFIEYFGIYKHEIEEQYLDKMFISTNSILKKDFMKIIEQWYNGYHDPTSKEKIYNVWSVVNYLSDFYIIYIKQKKTLQNMKKKRMPRLSLEGSHKPKEYWLNTGNNDIIEKVIYNNIDKNLLNKLKDLKEGNSINLSIDKNFNLYNYLKNKDSYETEHAFSYLLVSSGYLTQSDNKGTYKIPNNEVREYFNRNVVKAWVTNNLNVCPQLVSKFSEELSVNLGDHKEFSRILQSQLLSKLSPGEKPEAYFENLIGGIIEYYYLWNKEKALYYTIPQKTVNHGRIDNIFLPNQESKNKCESIIHEYKILVKTSIYNVETATNDALWQIYLKNYLAEPLAKYKFIQNQEKWRVKIRPIVFHQNENDSTWRVSIDSYEFNYDQAKKIHSFFDSISGNHKKVLADTNQIKKMRSARKEFLDTFAADSLENLIDNQIKCLSEKMIKESKYESEIKSFCDIEQEQYEKDSSDFQTETLSMSESVIEQVVKEAPKKAHNNLYEFLKNKGYNIKKKDIEIEFTGKKVGIGPKKAETLYKKIKSFQKKRKYKEAFPNSNYD